MKVAIVHELLTMKGGAERFTKILSEMFPDAPIYTLLYDEKKMSDWFPKERIRTSILQKNSQFSILNSQFNHHLYLSQFPKAVEAWSFDCAQDDTPFDLVISSSSAFAHGIITNGKPKHLCYVHSPARYLWDRTHDVQERAKQGFLGALKKAYLSRVFHKLRIWDAEVAPRPDRLIAASKEVQRRVELYWERGSNVIYPPIDNQFFQQANNLQQRTEHPGYFLIVSTLARYKNIDIAIDACNKTGAYLKIVGEGPDRKRLEQRAGSSIEFCGYRESDELADLYIHAIATIFPGLEDFGLVPVESMACGTPIIAYRGGGALETVAEDVTGCFFGEPTAASLLKTLESFDHKKYTKENCILQAQKFSRSTFEQQMYAEIDKLMK